MSNIDEPLQQLTPTLNRSTSTIKPSHALTHADSFSKLSDCASKVDRMKDNGEKAGKDNRLQDTKSNFSKFKKELQKEYRSSASTIPPNISSASKQEGKSMLSYKQPFSKQEQVQHPTNTKSPQQLEFLLKKSFSDSSTFLNKPLSSTFLMPSKKPEVSHSHPKTIGPSPLKQKHKAPMTTSTGFNPGIPSVKSSKNDSYPKIPSTIPTYGPSFISPNPPISSHSQFSPSSKISPYPNLFNPPLPSTKPPISPFAKEPFEDLGVDGLNRMLSRSPSDYTSGFKSSKYKSPLQIRDNPLPGYIPKPLSTSPPTSSIFSVNFSKTSPPLNNDALLRQAQARSAVHPHSPPTSILPATLANFSSYTSSLPPPISPLSSSVYKSLSFKANNAKELTINPSSRPFSEVTKDLNAHSLPKTNENLSPLPSPIIPEETPSSNTPGHKPSSLNADDSFSKKPSFSSPTSSSNIPPFSSHSSHTSLSHMNFFPTSNLSRSSSTSSFSPTSLSSSFMSTSNDALSSTSSLLSHARTSKALKDLSEFLVASGLPALPDSIVQSKLSDSVQLALDQSMAHVMNEFHRRGELIQELVKQLHSKQSNSSTSELPPTPDKLLQQDTRNLHVKYQKMKQKADEQEKEAERLRLELNELVKKNKEHHHHVQSTVKSFKAHGPSNLGVDSWMTDVVDGYENKVKALESEVNQFKVDKNKKTPFVNTTEASDISQKNVTESLNDIAPLATNTAKEDEEDPFLRLKYTMEQQIMLLHQKLSTQQSKLQLVEQERDLLQLKLLNTNKVSSIPTDSGASYDDTRHLIRRDKLNYQLKLFVIDTLPSETCRNLLKDICIELGLNDANQIVSTLHQVATLLQTLPNLHQFIQQVYRIVWNTTPSDTPEKTLEALRFWSQELSTLQHLRQATERILGLLDLPTSSFNENVYVAIEEIKRLQSFEINALRHSPASLVHQCQQLFHVNNVDQVFPLIQRLYLNDQEHTTFFNQVKDILEMNEERSKRVVQEKIIEVLQSYQQTHRASSDYHAPLMDRLESLIESAEHQLSED
ncbi:hypothetical protein HMI54_007812 [Coelomomyces lativittatus]|nr:hypothetical protein HMI56_006353 [Coelomomyces lativittatus]KAJ1516897.1 hypothetical protein HMI54_007812 [Coelomomyces lativittatus]